MIVVIATVGVIAVWFLRHQAPFHANWRWQAQPEDAMAAAAKNVPLELDSVLVGTPLVDNALTDAAGDHHSINSNHND